MVGDNRRAHLPLRHQILNSLNQKEIIMHNLFVRIQNNAVTDCWDTPPPAGQDGWKSAVEVRPAITAHRQGYTAHRFDLNTDPVQIVYGTYNIDVADRKNGMKANANSGFQQEMQRQMNDPSTYDPAKLQAANDAVAPKIAAIEAATTHDALDALM